MKNIKKDQMQVQPEASKPPCQHLYLAFSLGAFQIKCLDCPWMAHASYQGTTLPDIMARAYPIEEGSPRFHPQAPPWAARSPAPVKPKVWSKKSSKVDKK